MEELEKGNLASFQPPKPPAELPLPDPIVPSKSANRSFQLPASSSPFRPGLPRAQSASKCCVDTILCEQGFLRPKPTSLSYSLRMPYMGVSGVPNPVRAHGMLEK